MPLKHISQTQKVNTSGFKPLMRNEVPYYENLNRAARSAYEYADSINSFLSYGGFAMTLRPGVDETSHRFRLYEIVRIHDDNLIYPAKPTDHIHSKFGIVVSEAYIDPVTKKTKDITVCLFCPHFIYPNRGLGSSWAVANSAPLYLSDVANNCYLSGTKTSAVATQIGSVPLAIKTGDNSIFFSGTIRNLFI